MLPPCDSTVTPTRPNAQTFLVYTVSYQQNQAALEPPMTRTSHNRIEIFDADGKLVGVIVRPVEPTALGPGREKVYLARRDARDDRGDRAA
jgi:hypothetical protein